MICCTVFVVIILERFGRSDVVANVAVEPLATLGISIVPSVLDCLRLAITGVVRVLLLSVCSPLVVITFVVADEISDVVANVAVSPDATVGIVIVPPELDGLRLAITGVVRVLFVSVCSAFNVVNVSAVLTCGTAIAALVSS